MVKRVGGGHHVSETANVRLSHPQIARLLSLLVFFLTCVVELLFLFSVFVLVISLVGEHTVSKLDSKINMMMALGKCSLFSQPNAQPNEGYTTETRSVECRETISQSRGETAINFLVGL